ncbi:BF3164 family lipoprotein [Sediminibacterium ginsengisoli]|uniref:TolB-like 6-blade propeller-like n=1 Tax=Sediminibacterium ginsengisoli TaxID=413434 RepID=A0A1T4JUX4_9BACT|nr:BF3164 family lipoprotein [Sediminibacterium ginsengisoli]SJZ34010.1 TolB-like 6-blade propeller-like [Sediminibacterium ginsengisoli]
MYTIRNLLFFITVSVMIYGCATIRKFPASSDLAETRLMDAELQTPQSMTIYRDSLLLVMNNLNTNPHHIRVFDIAGKKAVNNLFPAGSKKGGTMAFMSFGISDSLVWVFDVAKNGFITANIDSVLKSNGSLEYYSEYRIKPQVFYYDATLLNRNEALLSGNYDTDEKLSYVKFADTTQNKKLLSYLEDSAIGSSRFKKTSYESFMLLKPDKKKLLLACRYSDQFELLDLTTGAHKKMKGPIGFAPQLAPFEDNSGRPVAAPDNATMFGFLKGFATEKFIYLLFSGNEIKSPRRFYSNQVLVYNWEGQPVKQFNLKNDIVCFSVSSDDKTLYTLNPRTRVISFSELKW